MGIRQKVNKQSMKQFIIVFNVGSYRRNLVDVSECGHDFFDPTNKSNLEIRK